MTDCGKIIKDYEENSMFGKELAHDETYYKEYGEYNSPALKGSSQECEVWVKVRLRVYAR